MSLEHFNGGCGRNICPESGPHVHPVCDECKAPDYTGRCATCITMRRVRVVSVARGWSQTGEERKA